MNFSNDQIQQLHHRLLETRVTVPGNRGAWLGGRGKTRFPRFNSRPRQAMRQRLVQLAVETVSEGEGLRKSETVYSRVKSALRVEAEDGYGFIDPVTLYWILRIAFLVAQWWLSLQTELDACDSDRQRWEVGLSLDQDLNDWNSKHLAA